MAGKKKIGVLALQGAFIEHINILSRPELNCQGMLVKNKQYLGELDGLIIPGGESTAIGKLMIAYDLVETITEKALAGMGVMGTCAGLILLAKEVIGETQSYFLKLIDIQVKRNAYGSQLASFEEDINIPAMYINSFPAIFIRAPQIIQIGNNVNVLARHNNKVVLARQGNILVSSFHPELTNDIRIHQYFLNMC